ncbi:hypothetical protein TNCV_1402971 [Trichonephila clavipes]|nr:hypothetical protein TNCV_1402971 [Trichonephila clavipes]
MLITPLYLSYSPCPVPVFFFVCFRFSSGLHGNTAADSVRSELSRRGMQPKPGSRSFAREAQQAKQKLLDIRTERAEREKRRTREREEPKLSGEEIENFDERPTRRNKTEIRDETRISEARYKEEMEARLRAEKEARFKAEEETRLKAREEARLKAGKKEAKAVEKRRKIEEERIIEEEKRTNERIQEERRMNEKKLWKKR